MRARKKQKCKIEKRRTDALHQRGYYLGILVPLHYEIENTGLSDLVHIIARMQKLRDKLSVHSKPIQ